MDSKNFVARLLRGIFVLVCAFFLLIVLLSMVSCGNDKLGNMKKELSSAYAAAADSLKNTNDQATAERIMEKLNTQVAGIEAKYKDVTENLTTDEKTSIDEFYKEQKSKLYENADEIGKKAIDAVTSATSAVHKAMRDVNDSVTSVTGAAEKAASDISNNATEAAKQAVNNAKSQVNATVNNAKNAAKTTVNNARNTARKKATDVVNSAETKANNEVNKAADKANKSIEKGLNKVLGQ